MLRRKAVVGAAASHMMVTADVLDRCVLQCVLLDLSARGKQADADKTKQKARERQSGGCSKNEKWPFSLNLAYFHTRIFL